MVSEDSTNSAEGASVSPPPRALGGLRESLHHFHNIVRSASDATYRLARDNSLAAVAIVVGVLFGILRILWRFARTIGGKVGSAFKRYPFPLLGVCLALISLSIAGGTQGIIDIATIEREGISAYMGTAPCNQVANGLYLRLNGQVQMCPGASDYVFGNVYERSIVQIWKDSPNYELGALDNNWCTAKVNGMPTWLQEEVCADLLDKYAKVNLRAYEPAN